MSLKRCCYMVKQVAYKVLNDVQTLFSDKNLRSNHQGCLEKGAGTLLVVTYRSARSAQ